jgi:eukaryotic-like serine/threonine-protein kinase
VPESPYWQIHDQATYRIQRQVARGGMGAVYEAYKLGIEGFEKRVALKVLLTTLTENDEFVTMFIQEAKLVADLVHENVVQIYQLGEFDQTLFMSLEWIEGLTLKALQRRHLELERPFPPGLAAFIVARLCRALEYAHTKRDHAGNLLGIVHRDVSPANVLMTYGGVVKLSDFGIAKALISTLDLEGEVLLGKVRYMSPEQARFQVTDRRSDVFSAGVVLYELLSGAPLFKGDDTIVTLEQVVTREIPSLQDVVPDVPPALAEACSAALERDRDRRLPSAAQFGYRLESFLFGSGHFGPTNLSLHRYLRSLYPDDALNTIVDPSVPDPYFDRLGIEL